MNIKNVVVALVTLIASSAAQAQQAVQWKVSEGGNGHWYQGILFPVDTAVPWQQARELAMSRGGNLVSLTTAAEGNWVYSQVASNSALWLGDFGPYVGLYQPPGSVEPSGGWMWVDGTANAGAVPWYWNQPDNWAAACGGDQYASYWTGGPWFPSPRNYLADIGGFGFCCCEQTERIPSAIIEWSADCNNDGIVDYGQCRDGTLPDYNGNNIPDCCESGTSCVVGNYPVEWRVAEGGNGHWYTSVSVGNVIGWFAAKAAAEAVGGYLACPTSQAENDWLWSSVVAPVYTGWDGWIGLYQESGPEPAGGWKWITGEPANYFAWCGFQPDNSGPENFGNYHGNPRCWNDMAENGCYFGECLVKSYLIEWSADCNGDGIVDYGQILQGQLADTNADGVPDICQQPTCVDADLFRNGIVNGADLGILLSEWGPANPNTVSDINHDGVVNGADLGILLGFWGPCPN